MNQNSLDWDKKAKQYYEAQLIDQSDIVSQVIDQLKTYGVLDGQYSLLDVGGGTGRYGVPLSTLVDKVVISDFSKDMLAYASKFADHHQRKNIQFAHADWSNTDLKNEGWIKAFDVVFTSMSPATRKIEGLRKMEEATRKWCVLNQFTRMNDSIITSLKKELNLVGMPDPHEDSDYIITVMTDLLNRGHLPIIFHSRYKATEHLSKEELIKRYSGRFESAFQEKGQNISTFLDSLLSGETAEIKKDTVMTTVVWEINQEEQ